MKISRCLGEKERADAVERAQTLAREHFLGGFNCAESSFWGVSQALGLPMNHELMRVGTAFGGGIGGCKSTCGALSGAIMAVGLALGRTSPDAEEKRIAYRAAKTVYDGFVSNLKSDACRDLNPAGFDWPGLREHCAAFVTLAARLAVLALTSDEVGG